MSRIRRRAMGNSTGGVEITIKGISRTMRGMGKEKCSGQMEVFMRVAGKEVYNMEWGKCSFLMEM